MKPKAWNWRLWVGFVICFIAPFGYFSLFDRVPFAFWISVVDFAIGIALLVGGLRRAFATPESYRGKVAGPILATLSLLVIGLFSFGTYKMHQAYPAARNAPRIGDKAPAFSLLDSNSRPVALASLLSQSSQSSSQTSAQRGILLVFYRGYW